LMKLIKRKQNKTIPKIFNQKSTDNL